MSVEELRRLLEEHKHARTLIRFLTVVDTIGDMFVPVYSRPMDLDEAPRLIQKVYGTILHFACLDQDGPRGEAKIHMILQAAKSIGIYMYLPIVSLEKIYDRVGEELWQGPARASGRTPLSVLIDNRSSTVDSVRMLCQSWPAVVNLSHFCKFGNEDIECNMTILMHLMWDNHNGHECGRAVAIVKVLLDAAEKTLDGAINFPPYSLF